MEKMELGKVEISGINAKVAYMEPIPRGIVGATVEIVYTDSLWDSLTKTVVFWGCCAKDVLNPGTVVEIPAEVVAESGHRLRVGVYGVDAGNNLVIPTLWADLGHIEYAADPSGDETADPQLPVWAQMQEQIEQLKNSGTGSGGQSDTARILLMTILRNGAYTSDQSANLTALEKALKTSGGSGSGGETVEPDEPGEVESVIAQIEDILYIVSGVTANQNGSVLNIA
jgi:hypothetical protein